MKIVVSQKDLPAQAGKKLFIEFYSDAPPSGGRSPDPLRRSSSEASLCVGVDKADEFLASLDRFIKKRKIDITVLKKANLEFVYVGLLTERVIRAIIAGLRF